MSSVNVEALNEKSMGELRAYGKQYYNIVAMPSTTKEQLIALIVEKADGGGVRRAVKGDEGGPPPGYARVVVERDQSVGGSHPVYSAVNTYTVLIPRGVECDIPIKIYQALLNSVRLVRQEDDTKAHGDSGRVVTSAVPRHNVRVIAVNEGEDPRGSWEKQRARKLAPYIRFYNEIGFYPSTKAMKEYIQSGAFKMVPAAA